MNTPSIPESHSLLTLKQIASWSCPEIPSDNSLCAGVPALQRGLVWKPQQIELLWDSILRGFPVGAFVICPRIESQMRTASVGRPITHHLLDGQQRASGIALAFTDPFSADTGTKPPSSMLWLDLMPNIPSNSTRQFMVRLTTEAHPWGFNRTDACGILGVGVVRAALSAGGFPVDTADYRRPGPTELGPVEAVAPVPFAWVLQAFEQTVQSPWAALADRIKLDGRLPWRAAALDALQSQEGSPALYRLATAVTRLTNYRIVLLQTPPDLMEMALQESSNDSTSI